MLDFPCVPWAVEGSIEEELVSLLDLLYTVLCGSVTLLTNCFLARSWRRPLGYEDPSVLASETAFIVKAVEALFDLFMQIDNSVIHDDLIHKVFYLFDRKQNGVIEFGKFVRSLSMFHPKARTEDKVQFAFKLYDLCQTGYIECEERLRQRLKVVSIKKSGKSWLCATQLLCKT